MNNSLQDAFDRVMAQEQTKRATEQLTLGKLYALLADLEPTRLVVGLGYLDSYRGYYADLAFDPDDTPRTVADLKAACFAAVGKTFCGYKGGDFVMQFDTPLWVSPYGDNSGLRLMGLSLDFPITPITSQEPD